MRHSKLRVIATAVTAVIIGHSALAWAHTGSAHVELRAWESSTSDERHAWGTVVDPDTLPDSVLKRCGPSSGSIILTALHALVSGQDANPMQPYKLELKFDGLPAKSTQTMTLCAALPNRDQVLFQTTFTGKSKGLAVVAEDQSLAGKKIDIGPAPNMVVQVDAACPLSSAQCGMAFLPTDQDAAPFQVEAKVSGAFIKEQKTDAYSVQWKGLSGASVREGGSIAAILVMKLDDGGLAVPASRKAFTESAVVYDWRRPTLRDVKRTIAEVMRVGINDTTIAPSNERCKLSDAYAGALQTADLASWGWSNEGLRSEFRPKRRTLVDVESALKAIGAAEAEKQGGAQAAATKCMVSASLETAVQSYLTALQYERLAGALSTLESVHMAGKPHEIGLSPVGTPIDITSTETFDDAMKRCTSEGPKLSWTVFATMGSDPFWAEPLTARVTCYMITHQSDGSVRGSGGAGLTSLIMDLVGRPAEQTNPCMLFNALRFAGVIDAKQMCTGDNEKVATTLWDAFKEPLGRQSWATNAGNASQMASLQSLFKRSEADGLIDIVGIFAMHRKWPLEQTVSLIGPTIIEAMTERFRLLGQSSYGDYGLVSLPAASPMEAKAASFRDQWKEISASLGLPNAAGSGEANTHAVARAFIRYQLDHSMTPASSASIQDKIGTMAEMASAMTNLAAAAIRAEVAALAP